MSNSNSVKQSSSGIDYKMEFSAGLSTYLTLSYIFLLNPILLSKAGMDISAAFFATVVSAAAATFIMGAIAKLPFAVAPAPSITTFFVSFVCIQLGLSWQGALAAVVLSGVLSILMTKLSIRGKLIDTISTPLRVGVLLAISGFLVANGLVQGKVVSYNNGLFDFAKFNFNNLISPSAIVLYTGLAVTLLFRMKWFRFSAAPILGILSAAILAASFGIKSGTKAKFSTDMFGSVGQVDFSSLLDSRFIIAMLIFFIIDFFAGVGKYIGLFSAMGDKGKEIEKKGMGNALYVDGFGNIIGGFLGASSLAVFVSSAVGIRAGGKTGWTAIFTSMFMLLGLFIIPLVGAIPVEATSGILIYVGCILIPVKDLQPKNGVLSIFDVVASSVAFLISFFSYGLDKAILLVFLVYTIKILLRGPKKDDLILILTTLFLLAAIIAQMFL